RLAAENRPVPAKVVSDRHARHAYFGLLPVDQVAEEGERRRIPAFRLAVHTEELRPVCAERLQDSMRHVAKLLCAAPAPLLATVAMALVAQVREPVLRANQYAGLVRQLDERDV